MLPRRYSFSVREEGQMSYADARGVQVAYDDKGPRADDATRPRKITGPKPAPVRKERKPTMTINLPASHKPARWRTAAAVLAAATTAALALATVPALAASAAPASAPRLGISSVFYTTSGAGTG